MVILAQDLRPNLSAKSYHLRTRKVENSYIRQLRKVAKTVGDIVNGIYDPENPETINLIDTALNRYAALLEPWATAVGSRMIAEVNARDRKAWADTSKEMSRLMRRELTETDIGRITQERLAEQVTLIKSLPLDAAQRVHKLTLEGLTNGTRAETIAKEIMRSGEVSRSRAMLIGRTEVSRTHAEFQRARAEAVGSTHFVWRTSQDSDVRPSHKALNGKVFRWDNPPECDPGYHALPGGIWNCRCYAEPVLSEWD